MSSPTEQSRPPLDKHSHRPPITSRKILRALFIQPNFLLPIALASWSKALKTALAAIAICGSLLAVTAITRAMNAATDWAAWFDDKVEEVKFSSGGLEWKYPETMPATYWKDSYRVDFMPAGSEFEDPRQIREGSRGIWISPRSIYWWARNREDQIVSQPLWLEGRLLGRFDSPWLDQELEIGRGEFIPTFRKWMWRTAVPAISLVELSRIFFLFFFYTLIFTVVPFIIRSSMSLYGFTGIHAFYLYTGVPPLLTTTIYSLFPQPWLDFNSLFVIGFLVYLAFIAWRTGRSLPPATTSHQSKKTNRQIGK